MTGFRPNWFFAVWPDDTTRIQLRELQAHLKGRMTRMQNLHLTLAFLGPQPDALLPLLRSILSQTTFEPFTLQLDRVGYFKRNRIAWAGTNTVPDALAHLQKTLSQELTRKGIASDTHRPYQPHITLARDASAPETFEFEPIVWRANRIVLARSPLAEERPWYQILLEKIRIAE